MRKPGGRAGQEPTQSEYPCAHEEITDIGTEKRGTLWALSEGQLMAPCFSFDRQGWYPATFEEDFRRLTQVSSLL